MKEMKETKIKGYKFKRLFDVCSVSIGLIVFSPVALIISLLILIEDQGPVLFLQERLGINKSTFRIFKFRSMNSNGITAVGKWLRSTGLDEIPQFLNIFKGDMTIVGPRPLTKEDVSRLRWDIPKYDTRWNIVPGITGLSQLHGGCGARSSWFLDKVYIKKQSICLDIKIIFFSLVVNVLGKKLTKKLIRGGR